MLSYLAAIEDAGNQIGTELSYATGHGIGIELSIDPIGNGIGCLFAWRDTDSENVYGDTISATTASGAFDVGASNDAFAPPDTIALTTTLTLVAFYYQYSALSGGQIKRILPSVAYKKYSGSVTAHCIKKVSTTMALILYVDDSFLYARTVSPVSDDTDTWLGAQTTVDSTGLIDYIDLAVYRE